ncbi:MAG: 2-polyprenyl-3-methyl-5-hydroxy-6-metoxy-1,4-benzoquinol methylase [Thiobacillus sp. 65-69]|nr:class I SAM-dependent methyltransferase [Thiobacillus sp.]ODU89658.1 MAG: 2-polyprenyl-3-methyl-5-hydroxy-6-metoxy-1,4-benzoquinol methylase [Thiobacillus sp. SCN 65-179]OJW37586.1 MAG: 2-polyprenyl-3-methyl-5-hydroxy-6-metoxy-1,4-benzoquinol methylase [Thiobacillus sp. 65-69]
MNTSTLRIADPTADRVTDEQAILHELLPLAGAQVLELGCGKADKTRLMAQSAASVLALEVDATQLAANRAAAAPANIRFEYGGAEAIPAADDSIDIVTMFKSLHHVPTDLMDAALAEIRRVLKPGGLAYISEPVYAGDFNELLRLFHDERAVREAAFAAEQKALATGRLALVRQTFFLQPMHFEDFAQYEARILKVTHTDHRLSPDLLETVRAKFAAHMTPDGATFHMPIRVDLLRKAA